MKGIVTYFFIGFLIVNRSFAQNLVPNNSFDNYTLPPNDIAQVCRATGWSSPSGFCESANGGTPDFFHTAGSGVVQPPNLAWSILSPHSGGGMEGFCTWYFTPANFREYLKCQLTAPMVPGTVYQVSFWISNGANSIITFGTNNIGIAFTTSPLNQAGYSVISSVTPQCEITSVFYSDAWQQFTFTFTAADAYQYMGIGNFRNDASTLAVLQSGSSNSGCYYYIDDIIVEPVSILPITLLNFNVVLNENQEAEITWSTATEFNNESFIIERSMDGSEFLGIGTVAGNGNSFTTHQYFFNDLHPADGLNYYRLKQQDINGETHYSETRVVEVFFPNSVIRVFPNPARDSYVSVILPENPLSHSKLVLMDVSGRMVLDWSIPEEDIEPSLLLRIPIGYLKPGLYFLCFLSGGKFVSVENLMVE